MAWLASNSIASTDDATHTMFNNLANDIRNWGGNVNGGGYSLSNVVSVGSAAGLTVAAAGANPIALQTNGAERLRVAADGKVGIATASPAYALDVAVVVARVGTTGTLAYVQIGANATDASNSLIGSETGDFVIYNGRYGGTATERVRVKANGRVGIGKASPGTNFAVAGLPVYADNAAATGAGLTAGDVYRTATGVLGVTY